ncbi:MAG TPA: type II toxin-antitoxin system HicB family antitoxin [Gammaproteobacteria bacterium]|nr:type II toxin-antitoxin system HicB family antitoxin [Gammaproteobacteria bacterium]
MASKDITLKDDEARDISVSAAVDDMSAAVDDMSAAVDDMSAAVNGFVDAVRPRVLGRSATAMKYRGFEAAIEYDHDTRLLYGQVLGLHEIVGFHGASVDELEYAFHAAVDDYLQDPLNEPSTRLTIDIPLSLYERFKAKAALRDEKMHQVVCRAIAEYVWWE